MPSSSVVCFSRQRWDPALLRSSPQLAEAQRVYVIEPPIFDGKPPWVELVAAADNVTRVVPHAAEGWSPQLVESWWRRLLERVIAMEHLDDAVVIEA